MLANNPKKQATNEKGNSAIFFQKMSVHAKVNL